MIHRHESFGETLQYAESLGFDSDVCEAEMMANEGGEYTPRVADGLEEGAIEFIKDKGVTVVFAP
jgi:hypothetical protein